MRVLFLAQGRKKEDQIGYLNAWANATSYGRQIELDVLPWTGYAEQHGYTSLWREILRRNEEFSPDLVFFQRFHNPKAESPRYCIEQLRRQRNQPLIFGDLGDLFQPHFFRRWTRSLPLAALDVARLSDLFFSTSMGDLSDWLIKQGARQVALLPLAFSNYHFPNWNTKSDSGIEFDITMIGSVGFQKRIPFGSIMHMRNRKRVADEMWKRYGKRFALFGQGWGNHPACRGAIPFLSQLDILSRSRIGLDSPPPYPEMYYGSNRPFYIAGAGTASVQFYTPRFDKMLREGEHVHFVRKLEDMMLVCDSILDGRTTVNGSETKSYIQAHHTVDKRVDTIVSCAEYMRDNPNRCIGDGVERLRLWHFLPEIDLEEEKRFAIRSR